MSQYLIDEYPLLIFPKLAVAIGLNESIVLQQIHYWIGKKLNFNEGYYWVYNSYKGWKDQFPFWSERSIWTIINKLEKKGLLIVANYNKASFDKTKWYRINYEHELFITDIQSCETISQELRDDAANVAKPIPETTTETTTYINTNVSKETLRTSKKNNTYKEKTKQNQSQNTPLPYNGSSTTQKADLQVRAGEADQVNILIGLFKAVNPHVYKMFFANKTQRKAAKSLIDALGYDAAIALVQDLPLLNKQPYCPTAVSPYELLMKLEKINIFRYNSTLEKKDNKPQSVII